jgi:pyroglutamyl-peptidase
MHTILVTGFEPFDDDALNPSAMVAQALHGRVVADGHRIVGHVLPCAFDAARGALERAVDAVQPSIVLALGLAGGRDALSFERVAVNLIDARIADNVGAQPIDQRVLRTSRDAYFTTLPVKAMAHAARAAGTPSSLSMSAGTFVCNAIFFTLMHRLARDQRRGKDRRGGFAHLPWLPEQAMQHHGKACLPLPLMVTGVHTALAAALRTREDLRVAAGTLA